MNGGQALNQVLAKALDSASRVHILGEALELSPATHGLLKEHPNQAHLLPAVDSALAGIAVGMALGGARPVVELAGPQALHGVLQQLSQEASVCTGEFIAPLVLRVPIAPSESIQLDSILAVPGVTVAAASSAAEARDLLAASLEASGPVVLIEPRWLLDRPVQEIVSLPLGSARVVREGEHCSIVCWGEGVSAARQASDRLSTEGIEAEVIDLRCLNPLDTVLLGESLQRTGRAILVGPLRGLLETVLDHAFLYMESPPSSCEPRPESIVRAVRESIYF